jgi:hypothetical protein
MKDLKQFIKTTIREFVEEQKINEDIFDLIGKYPNYFNNSYVSKIADKLGYKLKINLDSGNSGVAYILDGSKVLKITTDKTEFLVANKLKTKMFI